MTKPAWMIVTSLLSLVIFSGGSVFAADIYIKKTNPVTGEVSEYTKTYSDEDRERIVKEGQSWEKGKQQERSKEEQQRKEKQTAAKPDEGKQRLIELEKKRLKERQGMLGYGSIGREADRRNEQRLRELESDPDYYFYKKENTPPPAPVIVAPPSPPPIIYR